MSKRRSAPTATGEDEAEARERERGGRWNEELATEVVVPRHTANHDGAEQIPPVSC